jgi:hypothetical protein
MQIQRKPNKVGLNCTSALNRPTRRPPKATNAPMNKTFSQSGTPRNVQHWVQDKTSPTWRIPVRVGVEHEPKSNLSPNVLNVSFSCPSMTSRMDIANQKGVVGGSAHSVSTRWRVRVATLPGLRNSDIGGQTFLYCEENVRIVSCACPFLSLDVIQESDWRALLFHFILFQFSVYSPTAIKEVTG